MRTLLTIVIATATLASTLTLCGCDSTPADMTPASPANSPATSNSPPAVVEEHSHERGKMLIADAGEHHALLTAHLSPAGNELDIFFETDDVKNPQPVALPLETLQVQATAGDGEAHELSFVPAPAEERPQGEKAGTCSHFVAKAPWMKPEDRLLVVARVTIDGKEVVIRWSEFDPKKYAHHVE